MPFPQIWPRSGSADFYLLPTLFSWFDTPLGCSILWAQIYANISRKNPVCFLVWWWKNVRQNTTWLYFPFKKDPQWICQGNWKEIQVEMIVNWLLINNSEKPIFMNNWLLESYQVYSKARRKYSYYLWNILSLYLQTWICFESTSKEFSHKYIVSLFNLTHFLC